MVISKPGLSKDIVLQVLATCCFALQKCITVLDNEGLILDQNRAAEASEMLVLHVKAYAWLAAFFYSERKMVFRIRPKLHYIWHQAMQLKKWHLNVGAFATFHDESFLGKIKAVATACHGKLWLLEFMTGTFCVWPSWCTTINSWMNPLIEQGALGVDANLDMYWTIATTLSFKDHLISFTRTFWVSSPICCRGHATMPVWPCRQSRAEPSRGKRSGCDSNGCWNQIWLGTPPTSHFWFLANLTKRDFGAVCLKMG